ncbi:MAG: endonuclease III, partial [Candidatus Rokubacteria bacterium RIFCSPLOWO2_02_FULL_68_19]
MAESLEKKKARGRSIIRALERAHPDAEIALEFSTPLELLVATILAAQCTDDRVNQVTRTLFRKYTSAGDYAKADPATLEREIHSTGFYRAKARAVIGMAKELMATHGGTVPRTLEELTALPGVGRKTANVVLGNAYGQPAIAVDTHVFRVSQRLGLAKSDDPEKVHDQLSQVIPKPKWTSFT